MGLERAHLGLRDPAEADRGQRLRVAFRPLAELIGVEVVEPQLGEGIAGNPAAPIESELQGAHAELERHETAPGDLKRGVGDALPPVEVDLVEQR